MKFTDGKTPNLPEQQPEKSLISSLQSPVLPSLVDMEGSVGAIIMPGKLPIPRKLGPGTLPQAGSSELSFAASTHSQGYKSNTGQQPSPPGSLGGHFIVTVLGGSGHRALSP